MICGKKHGEKNTGKYTDVVSLGEFGTRHVTRGEGLPFPIHRSEPA